MTISHDDIPVVLTAAAMLDTIDAACAHVQRFLGVTDGGIASIHFSDLDEYDWATMNHALRLKRLREYINTEISYLDNAELAPQEPPAGMRDA